MATLGISSRELIQWNGSAIWKREPWKSLKLDSTIFFLIFLMRKSLRDLWDNIEHNNIAF